MPLEIIDHPDSLADMFEFRTSDVFEMMCSLMCLLHPHHYADWSARARAELGTEFYETLKNWFGEFHDGAVFFELGVDYENGHDVPGFIEYVRTMEPKRFLFYVLGRIFTIEQLSETAFKPEAIRELIASDDFCDDFPLLQIPLDWVADIPAFQKQLTDFLDAYWQRFFHTQIEAEGILAYRENAIREKKSFLARRGAAALLEQITGHSELPPQLPEDVPYKSIYLIPVYFIPRRQYRFFGYGNMTVLYDCRLTEERLAEMEQNKTRLLATLRALNDENRLKILRLIAQAGFKLNGKKIATKLCLSPSVVSRHLGQLKDGHLIIENSPDNRNITYKLQDETLNELAKNLLDYFYS